MREREVRLVRLRGSVGEWVGVGDGDAERVREGEGE